ncbi:MAG: hypothetical protein JJ902_02700 [Roseibium sp.]|nr:hypothetical protein [Roseibium sp.]
MKFKGLGVVMACAALAACQAADGTTQAPDTALVGAIMSGLGAQDPNVKPIEYRARAPLAMPASMDALPAPETELAGARSEAWPENERNPELEQVRALYADPENVRNENTDIPRRRLSPDQMRGIRIIGVTDQRRPRTAAQQREDELIGGAAMTPTELNAPTPFGGAEEEKPPATVVLQRRYLTEPPNTYNQPSPDAPLPEIIKTEERKVRDEYDGDQKVDMRCLEETGGDCRRGVN